MRTHEIRGRCADVGGYFRFDALSIAVVGEVRMGENGSGRRRGSSRVGGCDGGVFIGAGANHGQILLGVSKHGSASGFVNRS